MMSDNGRSASHEGNDLMAEVLTYFAIILGWAAMIWGANDVPSSSSARSPLGYILGLFTLFACIAAGYTGRMRDAVVATAIGAIAILGNTIIVIVV